jgi:hypothetical protein
MLLIKPLSTNIKFSCPYCRNNLKLTNIIWQGIHVCIRSSCPKCHAEIINDLPTGHAKYYPYQIDVHNQQIFGPNRGKDWLGRPLLQSLIHKSHEPIQIHKYVTHRGHLKHVVIVDCLDFMYGHCLLKLFNVQRYKRTANKLKIIVIIPECIRWLVPKYVHEIWSVNISLYKTREYNLLLETYIKKQLPQYDKIFLCDTNCHPRNIRIQDFSEIQPASDSTNILITYFWRHDRLTVSDQIINSPSVPSVIKRILYFIEKYKIIWLFLLIKRHFPKHTFALVGIGKEKRFPKWISDFRIPEYNQIREKVMCSVFAKSTIIIGTLGSHMILPAAHAFMTLELNHKNRTECFGQDMIVPTHVADLDPRLYYFRHRVIPSDTSITSLADTVISMVRDYQYSKTLFCFKMGEPTHTQ